MSVSPPQSPHDKDPVVALEKLGLRIKEALIQAAVSHELFEVALHLQKHGFSKETILGVVADFKIQPVHLHESNREILSSFARVVADRLLGPTSLDNKIACIDTMLGLLMNKGVVKSLLPSAEIENCKATIHALSENGGVVIPNSRIRKDCIELSKKTGLLWLPHSLQRTDSLVAPSSPSTIVTCRCLVKSEEAAGLILPELKAIATGLDGIDPIVCREECVDGGCYSIHIPASNGLVIDELPGVKERLQDEFSQRPLIIEYARDLTPEGADPLVARESRVFIEPSQANQLLNIANALSRSISAELIPTAISSLKDNQVCILLYFSSEKVAQTIADALNQFDLRPISTEGGTLVAGIASIAKEQTAPLTLIGTEEELLYLAQVLNFDAAEKKERSLSANLIRLSRIDRLLSQNDPASDLSHAIDNFNQASQNLENKPFSSFSSCIETNDLGNSLTTEIVTVFLQKIPTLGSHEVIEKLLDPQMLMEMVKQTSVVSLAQNSRARAQFAREIIETLNQKLNQEKISGLSEVKANEILFELHHKRFPAVFADHIANYHARLGLPLPLFLHS